MAIDPDVTPFLEQHTANLAALAAVVKANTDADTSDTAALGQLRTQIAVDKATQSARDVAQDLRIDRLSATVSSPPPWKPRFPGDVQPGRVRWGAAVGGNSDPVARHETPAGVPMGVRRTFWQWTQTTAMVAMAKADLAAGRLPWVSTKPSGTWANMSSGAMDTQIDAMLRQLDALGGPVWFTMHHEPEGGGGTNAPDDAGGAPAWRAMQSRIRARMTAVATKNIAFAPVLMSYTFDPASGRVPAEWWVDGIWDFAGTDHYIFTESATSFFTGAWNAVNAFYRAKGIPLAVGEWGNRGTNAAAAAEMKALYDVAVTQVSPQIVGLAAFDSGYGATGAWELVGDPLTMFHTLMKSPASVRVTQS